MEFPNIPENVTNLSSFLGALAQQDLPSRSITWEGSTSASYYGRSYSAAGIAILRPENFWKCSKMWKFQNWLRNYRGSSPWRREWFLWLGILSSASLWRGNQVDGLPRRPTSDNSRRRGFSFRVILPARCPHRVSSKVAFAGIWKVFAIFGLWSEIAPDR